MRYITLSRSDYIPDDSVKVDSEGTDAEIYYTTSNSGYPAMVAFSGRKSKPTLDYYYRSEEARDERKDAFIKSRRNHAEAKNRRAEKDKVPHDYKVGDILSSSWGWEQTNINFYQVTEIVGPRTIKVREIYQDRTHDGYMTGTTIPVKDRFKGDEFKRRVTRGSIKVNDCYSASRWSGSPCEWSSYA